MSSLLDMVQILSELCPEASLASVKDAEERDPFPGSKNLALSQNALPDGKAILINLKIKRCEK